MWHADFLHAQVIFNVQVYVHPNHGDGLWFWHDSAATSRHCHVSSAATSHHDQRCCYILFLHRIAAEQIFNFQTRIGQNSGRPEYHLTKGLQSAEFTGCWNSAKGGLEGLPRVRIAKHTSFKFALLSFRNGGRQGGGNDGRSSGCRQGGGRRCLNTLSAAQVPLFGPWDWRVRLTRFWFFPNLSKTSWTLKIQNGWLILLKKFPVFACGSLAIL
jgi:hypothetical protein